MARTKSTRQTVTVTVDAVDEIVSKLNELDGIEFAKDAWVNKAPENYGVVELSGEARQLWADGHLTDSTWTVIVTAYVNDASDEWPAKVQAKLDSLEDAGFLETTHTVSREFDYVTGKVRWRWTVFMYGELTRTVTGE